MCVLYITLGAIKNDNFNGYLQPLCHRLEGPMFQAKILQENSWIHQLVKEANYNRELIRVVLGQFEELRQSGLLSATVLPGSETRFILETMEHIKKSFCLPEIAEVPRLFQELENSYAVNAIRGYRGQKSVLMQAMESMHTPWLSVENRLDSIAGFVKLQDIGHILNTMSAFDALPTNTLRDKLGDWRYRISWPEDIFTNPLVRTSFYMERGLDPTLTAFPPEAFEESISIAGLKALPTLDQSYNFQPEAEDSAFKRNNAAHDRLQRFETQLRKFIDEEMKAEFGDNWTKRQVHGGIRKQWVEKREKAKESGESERPLIAYADFADYESTIIRSDNWERVFKSVFKRKTSVQESFRRLYPIRICTMHARLITREDELYLCAETTRILNAIGVLPKS